MTNPTPQPHPNPDVELALQAFDAAHTEARRLQALLAAVVEALPVRTAEVEGLADAAAHTVTAGDGSDQLLTLALLDPPAAIAAAARLGALHGLGTLMAEVQVHLALAGLATATDPNNNGGTNDGA